MRISFMQVSAQLCILKVICLWVSLEADPKIRILCKQFTWDIMSVNKCKKVGERGKIREQINDILSNLLLLWSLILLRNSWKQQKEYR